MTSFGRANNDFPQDFGFAHALALRSSRFRSRSFVSGGAWLPKYAPDLLRSAKLRSPVREATSLPPRLEMVQDVAAYIQKLLPDDLNIQQRAFHMAVSSLCSLARDSERCLAMTCWGKRV